MENRNNDLIMPRTNLREEYKDFLLKLEDKIKEIVPKDKTVTLNHVKKNNGIELDGIVICDTKENVSPNIYVNEYFEKYINGRSICELALDIIEVNDRIIAGKTQNYNITMEFNDVKDNITYRLINYKKNKTLLEEVPYIRILDLAVVFYYVISCNNAGMSSIRITNQHCKMWEIDANILRQYASSNTPYILPGVIRSMKDIIKDILLENPTKLDGADYKNLLNEDISEYTFGDKELDEEIIDRMLDRVSTTSQSEMYVLTNQQGINGASALLYNGLLKRFANALKSDLFILPSSIHEVILVAYSNKLKIDDLKEMVCEINQTQVPFEDVLSDNVYIYRRDKDSIVM